MSILAVTSPQPFLHGTHIRRVLRGAFQVGVIVTHPKKPVKKYEVVVGRHVEWRNTLQQARSLALRLA